MVRHARRELPDRLCVSSRDDPGAGSGNTTTSQGKTCPFLSFWPPRVLSAARQEKIDSSISSSKVIEFPLTRWRPSSLFFAPLSEWGGVDRARVTFTFFKLDNIFAGEKGEKKIK